MPASTLATLERADFWIRQSLRDIDVRGKAVIDIGAGDGLFTCYLGCHGARRVVALEPDASGSKASARATLLARVAALGLGQVECHAETLQSFNAAGERFDVVLANNVINHLDEDAVQVLATSAEAQREYVGLLRRMYDLLHPGGLAIIADCARDNFFARLGIRNPLAPSIEWHKHQNPELWSALLVEAGFAPPSVHWTYPRRLRAFGRLLATAPAAYLMESHFVLHAVRPGASVAVGG